MKTTKEMRQRLRDAYTTKPDLAAYGNAFPLCGVDGPLNKLLDDLDTIERKLSTAVSALEFYGNRMSYSMDYDTSNHGVSRRVILYSDQEEFNDVTSVAGRRARLALASIQAEGKEEK